jgi:hypothetical protein
MMTHPMMKEILEREAPVKKITVHAIPFNHARMMI